MFDHEDAWQTVLVVMAIVLKNSDRLDSSGLFAVLYINIYLTIITFLADAIPWPIAQKFL